MPAIADDGGRRSIDLGGIGEAGLGEIPLVCRDEECQVRSGRPACCQDGEVYVVETDFRESGGESTEKARSGGHGLEPFQSRTGSTILNGARGERIDRNSRENGFSGKSQALRRNVDGQGARAESMDSKGAARLEREAPRELVCSHPGCGDNQHFLPGLCVKEVLACFEPVSSRQGGDDRNFHLGSDYRLRAP